jgi:hypothetical protein
VNGDGIALVQELVVASNRDGTDAPFYAVYLPAKEGEEYCFSSIASEHLYGVHPFNAKTLKAKLDAEKLRLKLARYECGS